MVRTRKDPTYRLHKASGQALIEIRGKRQYLGKYNSPESLVWYHRICDSLHSGAHVIKPGTSPGAIVIADLVLKFLTFADERYVKNGQPTAEPRLFRRALEPVLKMYGVGKADDFMAPELRTCREVYERRGICRTSVNDNVDRVRQVWNWGLERGLVRPETIVALKSVKALKVGDTKAPETEPVRPAPEAHIEAAKQKLSPHLCAMIDLQLWSGMRPGEVCHLRTMDVDRTGKIWEYRPWTHKTEHFGKKRERTVYFGPHAQAILLKWLRPDEPEAYLFQPREARAWHLAQKRAGRKSPMTPSQRARKPKDKPKRRPGTHYKTAAYGHAIKAACKMANVTEWSPNQLRHNAATRIRSAYGVEAARIILGHASAVTSEIYAEFDRAKAAQIVAELG